MWKQALIGGLVAVNLGLVGMIAWRSSATQPVYAQAGRRTDFITIAGQQGNLPVLYVMDASTGRLAALRVEVQGNKIVPLATKEVGQDLSR